MINKVVIIDYGTGNLSSLNKSLSKINCTSIITRDPEVIVKSNKIILPGVGAYGDALKSLNENYLINSIKQALKNGSSVLGICLGMHLLCSTSEEGDGAAFSLFDIKVKKIKSNNNLLKIPNIGWHKVLINHNDILYKNIPNFSLYYFCHSFIANQNLSENTDYKYSYFEYGDTYIASLNKENIYGVQFHPELSGEYGLQILHNFMKI